RFLRKASLNKKIKKGGRSTDRGVPLQRFWQCRRCVGPSPQDSEPANLQNRLRWARMVRVPTAETEKRLCPDSKSSATCTAPRPCRRARQGAHSDLQLARPASC